MPFCFVLVRKFVCVVAKKRVQMIRVRDFLAADRIKIFRRIGILLGKFRILASIFKLFLESFNEDLLQALMLGFMLVLVVVLHSYHLLTR